MSLSKQSVFNMTLPGDGPLAVSQTIPFIANEVAEIDLTQLIENNWLDFVSGVYIDNSANSGGLTIVLNGTNQKIEFPAYTTGYVPILATNPPKAFITSAASATVKFLWYNFPQFPWIYPGAQAVTKTVNAGGEYTDGSIASLSGASETLFAANSNRQFLLIQNNGAQPIAVNLTGGAAVIGGAGSVDIVAGGSIILDTFAPTNEITIIGTAAESVTAFEG